MYQFWYTYLNVRENCNNFCNNTPEFLQFITAFCSIHKVLLKRDHYINEIIW